MAHAFYEFTPAAKTRAPFGPFASLKDAMDFAEANLSVVCMEVDDQHPDCADLFVATGIVYSIEPVADRGPLS